MGLPLPGQNAQKHEAAEQLGGAPEASLASSSQHVSNMWNWKPADSASEGADAELAAVEQSEEVTKAPAPVEEAPAKVEEHAPEPPMPKEEEALPEVARVEAAAVETPKAEEAAPAPAEAPKESSNPLGAFLGNSVPVTKTVVPEAPVMKAAKAPENSVLSSYMADLA